MSMSFVYHSPTTPGNPGFSVNLGVSAVRLGDIPGLQTEAELGSVATSALRFDDPDGTAGHNGDAIKGLKQISVNEGLAPSGNRRIGEYYIGDRRYYRGTQGSSPSLRTDAARIIDMTLLDINAFLSFRVFRGNTNGSNTSFNRPAETDVQRVTAMLAVSFLSTTLFNGLVSTSSPVNMDAVDYTGQRPVDVLNDCAQQSGKNFFVFYDEAGTYTPSPGDYALFYGSNDDQVYLSSTHVSNVLSDVDNSVTWAPLEDAILTRDPSRVVAGVLIQNGSNSVYVEEPTTAYAYEWRDGVTSSPNLKTVAQMTARANRYLSDNSSEDDRLSFTVRLPAAHVNDWKEGQAGKVRFSHLPGYETLRQVRCLSRTVMQDEETDALYKVKYECTPMLPQPSGAFAIQQRGVSYSGQPTLPTATQAGDLLIAVLAGGGETTVYPADVRFYNNPPVFPAPNLVPPYADHAGWTVLGIATTDYSGQPIGGPCGIAYHPGGGVCTAGLITAIAWRRVQAGEESTVPVAVSTEQTQAALSVWLWNLGPRPDPSGVAQTRDGEVSGPAASISMSSSMTGNILSIFAYPLSAGHLGAVQPTAMAAGTGGTLVQGASYINAQLPASANTDNWVSVVQQPSGGTPAATVTVTAGYTLLNYCGVAIEIPGGVTLPTIPYPANQVGP